MTQKALELVAARFPQYLEDLKTLVRIPSVSFSGYDAREVERSAAATAELLRRRGFENVGVLRHGGAHPYVLGDWLHAKGQPTALLYAHHDMQPPLRLERWQSPPFEPVERAGRLYGRGTADDKAGILFHAAALDAWLAATGACPLNLKVVIEGEEEIGSGHLEDFVASYAERLRADVLVVTDLANFDTGLPSLTVSLRGMAALRVVARATRAPLHSGMWSGPVPDPVMGLCKALAGLTDTEGRPALPGFEEGIVPLAAREIHDLKNLPVDEALFRQQTGMVPGARIVGGPGQLYEKIYRRPTLTLTSIEAGAGGIAGNVIMDEAQARVSLRLAPGMDARRATRLLEERLRQLVPWGLEVDISAEEGGEPWITNTAHPAFAAARKALAAGYGREPVLVGCGGSIPFVSGLTRALSGIPALLLGVEDPYTLAHSENESLHLGDFKKSLHSAVLLFDELARAF